MRGGSWDGFWDEGMACGCGLRAVRDMMGNGKPHSNMVTHPDDTHAQSIGALGRWLRALRPLRGRVCIFTPFVHALRQ